MGEDIIKETLKVLDNLEERIRLLERESHHHQLQRPLPNIESVRHELDEKTGEIKKIKL